MVLVVVAVVAQIWITSVAALADSMVVAVAAAVGDHRPIVTAVSERKV
jgi:hypothetical protein